MEVLEGLVESIIYQNEDTGYTVCRIRNGNKIISAVGIVPLIKSGQNVSLKGYYTIHKKFGKQFNINEYEEILPTSKEAVINYLSTGIIRGIGPITAKKIVNVFGEKTLDILENSIERLKEIEGIGEKKFDIIYHSYIEKQGLREIVLYFGSHGVNTNQCMKIYKKFGPNAKGIVNRNPYILSDEISGIGFKTADRIAMSIGIKNDSSFRIQSGIKYILNRFCNSGNTYMPLNELIDECSDSLEVKKEDILENIYDMAGKKKIIVEKKGEEERVLLLTYYYCELGITSKIINLYMQNYQTINSDIDFDIENFEKINEINFSNSQKEAIKGAFANGIEIITGGPGTGKTTIIKCIIDIYEQNGMKVLLCAPTGRAAKRMTESTGREARTIHRLLEMNVSESDGKTVFDKDESSPIETDVIVIDEASMIDVILMHNLLKAVKLGTRIIIAGDSDQLPSVGPGNVLKDLIESESIKVVCLKEIFRQAKESLIVVNAHRINEGIMPILNKKDKDFFFIRHENPEKILSTVIDLIGKRLPNFNKTWDRVWDIQVLSPMKKGTLGVINLNSKLQEVFNPKSQSKKEIKNKDVTFREGDKVMQIKNNYSLPWSNVNSSLEHGSGIFNGELGMITKINNENEKLTVIFDDDKKVNYDFSNLDDLDLSYAATIHKSQGSEFKVIVIPIFMGSPFLMNRNLLYTGITRAKQLVVIVGMQKALEFMIKNTESTKRYTSLKDRIKDIINKTE
ncbi:ATP-dependent RecD-like DNA helicase [Clostridium sp. BJN0001]|uniref:SF1B family DNA helicase RecD2 n=1 Tax=Clostridium sp. BJN0001 TaxID=2930219 RepID=UPI001FD0071D|nr:ATP-dependent RecD-like DNA helicase [Clostridium sp. BJN0001]